MLQHRIRFFKSFYLSKTHLKEIRITGKNTLLFEKTTIFLKIRTLIFRGFRGCLPKNLADLQFSSEQTWLQSCVQKTFLSQNCSERLKNKNNVEQTCRFSEVMKGGCPHVIRGFILAQNSAVFRLFCSQIEHEK